MKILEINKKKDRIIESNSLSKNITKYFEAEIKTDYQVINNYKGRRIVYREKIIDESRIEKTYYIKKYILHKKPKRMVLLGLQKNPCKHYLEITREIKKIGLNVVEAELLLEGRNNFFDRKYIIVMQEAGVSLAHYTGEFENYKKYFIKFFEYFIILCKNRIYPTDYNLGGMLLKNQQVILVDLDSYKFNKRFNKKLKDKLLSGLEGNYLIGNHSQEFIIFFKEEIEKVKRALKW